MKQSFDKILNGYRQFKEKYSEPTHSIMERLATKGQHPEFMIVSCCDSRVDPALILQCDPGDLFIARNVANIIPPYENDEYHHGTSAALEFGICYLNVKHLIILGHSQCGGIKAMMNNESIAKQNDFIGRWVGLIENAHSGQHLNEDECAIKALNLSYNNCLTFPWIKSRVEENKLAIHRWFFNIKEGEVLTYDETSKDYITL